MYVCEDFCVCFFVLFLFYFFLYALWCTMHVIIRSSAIHNYTKYCTSYVTCTCTCTMYMHASFVLC